MAGADDLMRLSIDLTQAGQAAQFQAPRIVAKAASDVEAAGKARCPVDTGTLRNSIGSDLDLAGASAIIGPAADYGAYVEYGTSGPRTSGPQPYMGPALDQVAPGFIAAIEKLGGDIL